MTQLDRCLMNLYLRLTSRQREVVYWVSQGLSNDEVAREMNIEACVVAGHLTNIYGEMSTLETLADRPRINRHVLIHLFSIFFHRYGDMLNAIH